MSDHHEKPPKTRLTTFITRGIIVLTIIMFFVAFHPLGTIIFTPFPEDEVVVGVSLELEGEMAEFGIEYQRGIELAIEDINDNGGVRGVPVRAKYYDNKGNCTLAQEQFKEIRDLGIPVVIGAVSSTVTLCMAPYAEEYGIVLISPSATSPSLSDYNKYVYRTVSSDIYLGAGMVKIAAIKKSTPRVMIINVDSSYGNSIKKAFIDEANISYPAMRIVSTVSVPDSDIVNSTEIVEIMKNTSPDSVLLIVNPTQAVKIMLEAQKQGLRPAWFGTDTTTTNQIPREVGEYAEGMIGFAQARKISDPTYQMHYDEMFNVPMMIRDSIYGYDTMMVVAQAIENSGYTANGITQGLDLIRNIALTGSIVFDENGDAYPSYDVTRLENGKWVDLPWKEIFTFDEKAAAISSYH
ncbi:MAG TPA: ABC transporter substrate-binding protein [Methanocorpusculum sp.]|nr:ABC transporter substrate-binding protein [Methanocorpusculum sp.]HJJ53864.1 ABC transporter substrate-binding protein [Methanocorpusculum sp.]